MDAQPTTAPIQVSLRDTGPYYILISSADSQKTRSPYVFSPTLDVYEGTEIVII